MFVFALERGLLRLSANTPAFAPLFQLPPRIGSRFFNAHPFANHPEIALIQPPSIRPSSSLSLDQCSYFLKSR